MEWMNDDTSVRRAAGTNSRRTALVGVGAGTGCPLAECSDTTAIEDGNDGASDTDTLAPRENGALSSIPSPGLGNAPVDERLFDRDRSDAIVRGESDR